MTHKMKTLFILTLISVFAISCSKKTKPDGAVGTEGGAGGAPVVESQPINFNPQGSDTGSISGLSTIHFEYDDSTIKEGEKSLLTANADWIKKNSNLDMQIEGHCDERGSVEYNLALGEKRAKMVKQYLVSLGVPANRLRTVSYGKEKKIDLGDSDSAHSKNRRANFVPLPK